MTVDTADMVVCATVGARRDYRNSLFSGMSEANLDRSQQVQNSLGQMVASTLSP